MAPAASVAFAEDLAAVVDRTVAAAPAELELAACMVSAVVVGCSAVVVVVTAVVAFVASAASAVEVAASWYEHGLLVAVA